MLVNEVADNRFFQRLFYGTVEPRFNDLRFNDKLRLNDNPRFNDNPRLIKCKLLDYTFVLPLTNNMVTSRLDCTCLYSLMTDTYVKL